MRQTLKQALHSEPLQPTAAFSESVDEALDRLPARHTKSIRPPRRLAMALCAALVLCALPLGYRALAPNGHPLAQPDPVTSPMPEQDTRTFDDFLATGEHVLTIKDGEWTAIGSQPEQAPFEQLSAVPMPQVTEPDDAIPIPTVSAPDDAIPIPTLPPAPVQTSRDPDYALRLNFTMERDQDGKVYSEVSAPLGDRSLSLIGLYAQFGQLKLEVATDDGRSVTDLVLRRVYINGEPVTASFPIAGKAPDVPMLYAGADGEIIFPYPMLYTCVAPEVDNFKYGGRHLISAVFEQNGQAAVLSTTINARSGRTIDGSFDDGVGYYGLYELGRMLQENCVDALQPDTVFYPPPADEGAEDTVSIVELYHTWGRLEVTARVPLDSTPRGAELRLDDTWLYLIRTEKAPEEGLWTLTFFTDAKPGAYADAEVELLIQCGGTAYTVGYKPTTYKLTDYASKAWKMDYEGLLDSGDVWAGRIFLCEGPIEVAYPENGLQILVLNVAEEGAGEPQFVILENQSGVLDYVYGEHYKAYAEVAGTGVYEGQTLPKLVCRFLMHEE